MVFFTVMEIFKLVKKIKMKSVCISLCVLLSSLTVAQTTKKEAIKSIDTSKNSMLPRPKRYGALPK
jgi:hypothetical protein